MQKLDFVHNLELLVNKLKSQEIVEFFEEGFYTPTSKTFNYAIITPLLFESKSNYEQLKDIDGVNQIQQSLELGELYDHVKLANLAALLKEVTAIGILSNVLPIKYYAAHKALVENLKLAKGVLLNNILSDLNEVNLDHGIVLFQILIDSEGLETSKYIKIISAIQELFSTINKIYNEDELEPEIVLFDSGSDTNVGVKSSVETAKSVFLVFKEIWDFIINFKHYKQGVTNKSLLESLTIREEIKKKVEAGVITEEEGKEYAHMIKTRTDDLIGMKVMPKQIVIDSTEINNKKLLSEFEGYRMLSNGE